MTSYLGLGDWGQGHFVLTAQRIIGLTAHRSLLTAN